jgi:hypothetical protein
MSKPANFREGKRGTNINRIDRIAWIAKLIYWVNIYNYPRLSIYVIVDFSRFCAGNDQPPSVNNT